MCLHLNGHYYNIAIIYTFEIHLLYPITTKLSKVLHDCPYMILVLFILHHILFPLLDHLFYNTKPRVCHCSILPGRSLKRVNVSVNCIKFSLLLIGFLFLQVALTYYLLQFPRFGYCCFKFSPYLTSISGIMLFGSLFHLVTALCWIINIS